MKKMEKAWRREKKKRFFFFFFFFFFFRATHAAYVSSQARSQIGATASGFCHSHHNAGSEPHLQPTPQLMAVQDP